MSRSLNRIASKMTVSSVSRSVALGSRPESISSLAMLK